MYRLGSIHEQNHAYTIALRYYKMLLQRSPGQLLVYNAKFGQAKCLFELERYDEVENLFKEISYSHPDTYTKWEARLYLGRLNQKRLDYKGSIEKLKAIYLQSEVKDLRNQAKDLIYQIVRENLTKVELIGLSRKYFSEFPGDQILLRLISIYREERDIEKLKKGVKQGKPIKVFKLNKPVKAGYGEDLDEAKFTPAQVSALKKAYGNFSSTGVSAKQMNKLRDLMKTYSKDHLDQLAVLDIPMVSKMAKELT